MRCGDRPHFDITTTVFENSFRIGLIAFVMLLRALKKVCVTCVRLKCVRFFMRALKIPAHKLLQLRLINLNAHIKYAIF